MRAITREGVQTLIDLPFIALCLPVLIITPYKAKYLLEDLRKNTPNAWRMTICNYLIAVVTDLPYIIMLVFIILSVYMAYRLKTSIDKK